jgi:hypothetical protein
VDAVDIRHVSSSTVESDSEAVERAKPKPAPAGYVLAGKCCAGELHEREADRLWRKWHRLALNKLEFGALGGTPGKKIEGSTSAEP